MTVRDNSRAEYWAARLSGRVSRQQAVILDNLELEGWGTRAEIAVSTGIAINAVCGRVKELLDAKLIDEGPLVICDITGRKAHVIRLKGDVHAA